MSLNRLLDAISEDEFDERPVDLKTFLYSSDFLGLTELSPIQYEIVARGSQIYKKDTIDKLYEEGILLDEFRGKSTRYLLLILGKGSGKDFVSQLICCYAVYKLLCLKDPCQYYGKPTGETIAIVNMAINAKQAKRVFFDGLVARVKNCPWFAGKYVARNDDLAFDKNVTVFSMHSSHEAAEGLHILIAVLDEIDGFEIEGQADAIYDALSGTVSSRFSEVGKVICLSFPRSKDGFMMRQYRDAVLQEKLEIKEYSHTFKLNEDLEDGAEGNEFTVTWEEDIIHGYKYSNYFALKAPTFRVNPTKFIEDYTMDFYRKPDDTLMRVCANPPETSDTSFFKNHDKLAVAFSESNSNGYNHETQEVNIQPEIDKTYYIHIDLSKVHDRTVVALGHVSGWRQIDMGALTTEPSPDIVVDLFRVWEPTKKDPVDHGQVMQFIIDLCKKFKVEWVTFDQWGSQQMIENLNKMGIPAERKPLARPEYQEFLMAVGEQRLSAPYDERLWDELIHLVILPDGKVDHPKKNHNDISEAICGVIRNCVTKEQENTSVEIVTLGTLAKQNRLRQQAEADMIAPKQMPGDIQVWLEQLNQLKGI